MERDTDRQRQFTRRAALLGGMKLALFGALGARMYYLQVVQSERFTMLAEENRINMRLLPPSRGQILDRNGVPLANNEQNFRVLLVSEQARDVVDTLERLGGMIDLSPTTIERVIADVRAKRAFVPVTVKENLSWDEVSAVEVNAPRLPGVSIEVGEIRHYPHGPSTAHILGYVGAVAKTDLDGDPVLALPGFRIGKNGIERSHEQRLRGAAGTSQIEVNAVGRVIRELQREEGTPGDAVRLTVDIGLQTFIQNRLSTEQSASAVVMDSETGAIYALASHPTFDPNIFSRGISAETWEELLSDPTAPLTNKAIAGQYPPGSTFKMVTAMAALEEGIVDRDFTAFCPGHLDLGNHRFHCWRRGGHGRVGFDHGIAQSCDVFFYELARQVGIDRIARYANKLGLGATVGLEIPGERPGLMPTTDWKLATVGERWQQGESLVSAIGQGYVLTTPLQLAVMTARLVNGGFAVTPHLTETAADNGQPREWAPLQFDPANVDLIVRAMNMVTSHERGTARAAQIDVAGLEMGGKTGTAQVRRITMEQRRQGIRNEDLPWRHRHHALFVGYAPREHPRYATAVVVEHGGGGSSVAAPIARDILLETQRRDPAGLGIVSELQTGPGGLLAGGG